MSRLKQNVAASLAGNLWNSVLSLLFVPIYIHYLGIEGWGLIGFFVTLQNILLIADMGLSTTLNREFARTSATDGDDRPRRDLLRTLEFVYWLVGAAVAVTVAAAAPLIAGRWLHVQHLSPETARHSIMLMGVLCALQLPLGLYSGGLVGLQQQLRLNGINIVLWTMRGIGAVAVVAVISPTAVAWFAWQVLGTALHTAIVGITLWRSLGASPGPIRFRKEALAGVWRFSAGMTAISATAAVLNQMDKVILSKILTLEMFGYYTLAALVAGALYRGIVPLYLAFFPRLTELIALGDDDALRSTYHSGAQLTTVLIVPPAAVVAFFAPEVLLLWTRNAATAEHSHMILSLLMTATALSGLALMPYTLQLASGWTRLAFSANIAACLALVPSVTLLALRYGSVGAACALVVINGITAATVVFLTHRRWLRGERKRFFGEDVAKPMASALAVVVVARLAFPENAAWIAQVICISAIFLCAFAAAAVTAPAIRQTGAGILSRIFSWRRRAVSVE